MCLWIINTCVVKYGSHGSPWASRLGNGGWGLLLDYSVHTQLWKQTHMHTNVLVFAYTWLKYVFYILLYIVVHKILLCPFIFLITLVHKHKLRVHYCGEECCVVKMKAEQDTTGDCINTQALCYTCLCSHRAANTHLQFLLTSHIVHIYVNLKT